MMSKLARVAIRALRMGIFLPVVGLAGCVTASVQNDALTRSTDSSAGVGVTSTHGPPRAPPVSSSGRSPVLLTAYSGARTPAGAVGLCGRYPWACATSGAASSLSEGETISLAKKVNRAVNRKIRSMSDRSLYGRDEHWALPTRAGDCEDYVLLKKKMLLAAGVPASRLFIATGFNRRMEHHVVLVLRTARGDLVLDNLTNAIKTWQATGYTYLKRQNPTSKARWEAVLLGPYASRT